MKIIKNKNPKEQIISIANGEIIISPVNTAIHIIADITIILI